MTAKTKTQRFKRLISHGFFAPELPPCFVSSDLAQYRESLWTEISNITTNQNSSNLLIKKFTSEPAWFYFPRYGKEDRKHAVINPISYLAISKTISDNFVQMRSVSKRSKISASPLLFDWNGSRAIFRPNIDLRDDFRINLSARHEKYISADIRAFFHSIYTHAIPWAIRGKDEAKQNRWDDHFSNTLDLYCRNAQDGQTIGLPVGPDTSRIIAEVIAAAIDCQILNIISNEPQDASRYIDDYTVAIPSEQSGDSVLSAIRQSVANFELELEQITQHRNQGIPLSRQL